MQRWHVGVDILVERHCLNRRLRHYPFRTERTFVTPWEAQVRPALQGKIDKLEVQTLLGNKRALGGRVVTIALFALIIALMVVKPDLTAVFGA